MSDKAKAKKKTNIVVWAILGLLVLALGGFGAGQFGGSLSAVATVGDREITVQDYANAIQSEQQRLSQQTGQALTLQQMQLFGLDQQVMERLLASAALEQEADQMGLSVGDAEVAKRIRATPAFGGISGSFDREGYTFALRNAGLSEKLYEARVRDEAARELLQATIIGGISAPDVHVDAILGWLAETRNITVAEVGLSQLDGISLAPSATELQAFYDDNSAAFQTPETRRVTYAWITPDALIADIDVDEARLRERYAEMASVFSQPARVLAERLNFRDQATADAALAAILSGETDFDTLVEERGLTLDDVDQGEIAETDVDAATAAVLFALQEPGLAGPVETSLGPAIFRVNAILDATEVPFEDVRDELASVVAIDTARRQIDASREAIDDLLAGGATLEEIASETDMVLGEALVFDGASGGPNDYDEFRAAALVAAEGDFPELEELSDGGLFALRLDGITAPMTPPLDEIRDRVEQAWQDDTTTTRLFDAAQALAARIEAGETFEDVGLTADAITGLTRDGTVEGLPRDLLTQLFATAEGTVLTQRGTPMAASLVRLDAIVPVDAENPDVAALRDAISTRLRGDLAGDAFSAYGLAVRSRVGFSVDNQAVTAVQSQLLGGNNRGQ